MVESIGPKPVKADLGVTRVAAAMPAQPVRASNSPVSAGFGPNAGNVKQAGSLAQTLSAAPPVDLDRVGRVKQAIADGTYPIEPGTIADSMIAIRLQFAKDEL